MQKIDLTVARDDNREVSVVTEIGVIHVFASGEVVLFRPNRQRRGEYIISPREADARRLYDKPTTW